ncbi:MAG: hypothetical protein U0354_01870 [Candidatus Sericytochromatia bacterium]
MNVKTYMKFKALIIVTLLISTSCNNNYQVGQNISDKIKTNNNDTPPLPCFPGETDPNCIPDPIPSNPYHGDLPLEKQYYKYLDNKQYNSYLPKLNKGDKITYDIKSKKYPNIQKTNKVSIEILGTENNTLDYKYSSNNNINIYRFFDYNSGLNSLYFDILIDGIRPEQKKDTTVDPMPSDLYSDLYFCKNQQICTETINFQGKMYDSIPIIRVGPGDILKKAWVFDQNPENYVSQFSFAKDIGIVKGKIKYRIPDTNNFNEADFQLREFSRAR